MDCDLIYPPAFDLVPFVQSATRSKINPFVNNLLDASREGRLKDVTELVNGKGVSVDSRSKVRTISAATFVRPC